MTDLFDLTGKVAVITGSSRGIGRASAEAMAERGARVVISSRKQDACEAVADAINARHPGAATAIAATISSKTALEELVTQTQATVGPIDILVCNAASNPYYGPMSAISDDAFRKILDNNILSNHWLIQLCLPGMIERRDGAIIVVSSVGGLRGSETLGGYCISKAADMQLVRNLAVEVGRHNIRANSVAPGLIRTDMARALWENPVNMERYNTQHPMRRIGEAMEIAGAVVFLASRAGSYVNGQTIVVDGGSTI
ncbi:SDR family NAD(P)-dependent oxidoreductase [Novosphingobium sp. Gsoil 351]|uniref:SDR family NAD(P)-dependent oxidoreductase n=1 Tax=Novosphingobium sp. Gsoil 351 TaxID=2675225 RepID=UPI0012B45E90|nr:SDR family oxidoreductase [Novosphingobium sp. Gsoil 351]QGN55270.1 glucose 1-dehydrogenase [Novosphingobium sp. Gsoil 351]